MVYSGLSLLIEHEFSHAIFRCDNFQVSEILPAVTQDEIDLDVDSRRDEEIKGDKPPHHG